MKILSSLFFLLLACSKGAPVEGTIPASKPVVSREPANAEQRAMNDSLHKIMLTAFVQKKEDSYDHAIKNIHRVRESIRKKYEGRNVAIDSLDMEIARQAVTKGLLEGIFPHWYGTAWDFNGYTDRPGKGAVACGYFVSTTLKHCGFDINRFTLAQQGPYHEALTLSLADTMDAIVKPEEGMGKYFNDHGMTDGLYFAGLDMHVGYLYRKAPDLFFIHSNYTDSLTVVVEVADSSKAFNNSGQYYITPITSNDALIRKWILNEAIRVIRPQE
jgi:hypothetical protein